VHLGHQDLQGRSKIKIDLSKHLLGKVFDMFKVKDRKRFSTQDSWHDFSKTQCLSRRDERKRNSMISDAIGSIMFAMTCTPCDISYA